MSLFSSSDMNFLIISNTSLLQQTSILSSLNVSGNTILNLLNVSNNSVFYGSVIFNNSIMYTFKDSLFYHNIRELE